MGITLGRPEDRRLSRGCSESSAYCLITRERFGQKKSHKIALSLLDFLAL